MIQAKDTAETELLGPGRRIGDVVLGRLLGAGVSSEVYQAESLVAGKACAVKVFRRELRINPVSRGRYRRVAHEIDHLGHSGIADVFAFGETPGGRAYAICELAPGRPLTDVLRQPHPLPRRVVVSILRNICNVLALTHARGIPHLRLHPGNVMVEIGVNDVSRLVLLDFGVHQLHAALDDPQPGLPLRAEDAVWVAPEQARGEPGDSRTDVYALSVLLYELLTGRVPFLGSSYKETLEQHVSTPPPPPGQIVALPADLEQTILRGLEKDPRRRVPSVEALLSAVDPLSATTGQHEAHAKAQAKTQGRQRTLGTGEFRVSEVELHLQQRPASPLAAPEPRIGWDSAPRAPGPPIAGPTSWPPARWPRQRLLLFGGLALAALLFGAVLLLL